MKEKTGPMTVHDFMVWLTQLPADYQIEYIDSHPSYGNVKAVVSDETRTVTITDEV